jgi:hypothetical protein
MIDRSWTAEISVHVQTLHSMTESAHNDVHRSPQEPADARHIEGSLQVILEMGENVSSSPFDIVANPPR